MKKNVNLIILATVFISLGAFLYKMKGGLGKEAGTEEVTPNLAYEAKPPAELEERSSLDFPPSEKSVSSKKEGEDEPKLFPVNISSEEVPKYFEIIDEVDPELLRKILDHAEQAHFSFNDERFKGQMTWMKGLHLGAIAFQLPPDELPTKGYISEDFYFYVSKGVSNFSEGFAVNRKDGKIFKWDISDL